MNSHYTNYFLRQQQQHGGGIGDIGQLYSSPYILQRGSGGVGSFFSGVWKYLSPLVSSGVSALSNEALKSGSAILGQVGQKPLKEVLKEQGKIAMKNLATRAADKLKRKMQGGEGRRKKNIKRPKQSNASHSRSKRKQAGKGKRKQAGKGKRSKRNKKFKKSVNRKQRNPKTRIVDIFGD